MKILIKIFTVLLIFSSCQKKEAPTMRFMSKSAIDTIPFQYGSIGHMMVDVIVDSIPYSLLVDTGSSITTFHADLKLEGETIAYDIGHPSTTAININGDKVLMPIDTKIKKVSLSNINVLNFDYPRVKSYRINSDGILGNNILNHFVFKIDFYRSEILFSKHIAKFDLNGYESFPLSFHNDIPYIDVTIANKPFSLAIDTGNPANFISLNNKERRHFNPEEHDIHNWKTLRQPSPFDSIWTYEQAKIDELGFTKTDLQLGNYQLTDQYINLSSIPTSQVGLDFLGRFGSVIFDYRNKRVYLAKPKNRMSLNQLLDIARYANSNGVIFSQDSIHKTVISISPIAETNGIKLRDTLVSLRGLDMRKTIHKFPDSDFTITSNVLIDNFHYTMGNSVSTLELKSTDGIKKYILNRQYPVKQLPDTVQSFGFSPTYMYVSTTAVRKKHYTTYKVRQLPAEIRALGDSLLSLK